MEKRTSILFPIKKTKQKKMCIKTRMVKNFQVKDSQYEDIFFLHLLLTQNKTTEHMALH